MLLQETCLNPDVSYWIIPLRHFCFCGFVYVLKYLYFWIVKAHLKHKNFNLLEARGLVHVHGFV